MFFSDMLKKFFVHLDDILNFLRHGGRKNAACMAGPPITGPSQDTGSGPVANPDHQETAPADP